MGETFQNFKHILYRVKTKALHQSRIGKFLKSLTGWRTAEAKDHVDLLFSLTRDVFGRYTMNHLSDNFLREHFTDENRRWQKHNDDIYIIDAPVYIEPVHSLVILETGKFVAVSKSKAHTHLQPSRVKYLSHKFFNGEYTQYDTLIHFDGYASKNLYHFFDDAFNPLLLLIQQKIVNKNIPILIHENVYSLKYVQYVLSLPEFASLNWVVQKKGEWIKANKVYKAVSSKEWWNDLYQMMERHVEKRPCRKVFLNRKPKFQRRLLNNDAIEQYLVEKGFEVIYAEDLTYAEQVKLFSEVKYFIASHGAGMTNLLYSKLSEVYVLELFSESLANPHFYWFLEGAKVKYYDAVLGSKLDINWNYLIDEKLFKERVEAMLSAA